MLVTLQTSRYQTSESQTGLITRNNFDKIFPPSKEGVRLGLTICDPFHPCQSTLHLRQWCPLPSGKCRVGRPSEGPPVHTAGATAGGTEVFSFSTTSTGSKTTLHVSGLLLSVCFRTLITDWVQICTGKELLYTELLMQTHANIFHT